MDREKILELKARIVSYRMLRPSVTSAELIALARDVGRVQDGNGNWVSTSIFTHPPIIIPVNPSDLNRYVVSEILLYLEDDVYAMDELLDSREENYNDLIN